MARQKEKPITAETVNTTLQSPPSAKKPVELKELASIVRQVLDEG